MNCPSGLAFRWGLCYCNQDQNEILMTKLELKENAELSAAVPVADLPTDYIDTSITDPCDRSLLEVFHRACNSEGGSADEVILRGLKAVLATTTTPAPDAGDAGRFKNLLAVGGGCGGGLKLSPDQCQRLVALLEQISTHALPLPEKVTP